MCDDRKNVTIGFSLFFVGVVIAHALLLATAERVAPRIEQYYTSSEDPHDVQVAPRGGINWDTSKGSGGGETLPVNPSARDEIKRGGFFRQASCPTCIVQTVPIVAQVSSPYYPQPVYPQPAPRPVQPVQPAPSQPSSLKPVAVDKSKYSLDLFVSNDEQSKRLLGFFQTDQNLAALRSRCNWQVYTPDNLLYKTRYARLVSTDDFPALIFSDPSGGHVHIITRHVLPASSSDLLSDLRTAYLLQKEVIQSRPMISQLGSDCDGGICPPLRPDVLIDPNRDRVFPLFDRDKAPDQSVEGLLRALMNPGETVGTLVLLMLCVVVAIVLLRRK